MRQSRADISFKGANITNDIAPYLLSVTYTDNEDGETDDLQIRVQDRDSVWLQKWLTEALNAAVSSVTTATAQNAAQTTTATQTATVTAPSGLRLRAGPSTSTARLSCAPYGSKVTVLDHSGSWWQCSYGGQNGYMWNSWLKLDEQTQAQAQTQVVTKPAFLIESVFHRLNWTSEGTDETLDTGAFELDSVNCSGPPSIITIKGTSLPYSSPIRQTKKTKAWEKYKLSGMATEMASAAGMAVQYLSVVDPDIVREEQTDEADITFLSRVAHRFGLSVKATNKNVVIFDQFAYEKLPSVRTIQRGRGYSRYKVSTSKSDTQYDTCRVRYVTPQGVLIEGIAKVSDYDAEAKAKEEAAAKKAATSKTKPTAAQQAKDAQTAAAQQLEVWYAVKDIAEAKALAEKTLRMHNKFSKTGSFTLEGDPKLVAGANVTLTGFGPWDGKYCISSAKHTIDTNGYTTTISLRSTLENY